MLMSKEIKIIINGTIRSKKNSKRIFATGKSKKVLPSKSYVSWEQDAWRQMRAAGFNTLGVLSCPIEVTAMIYYKGPRPDLSGALESIGDCLQKIIWADDAQIESWDGSRLIHDKDNPRTEITVKIL